MYRFLTREGFRSMGGVLWDVRKLLLVSMHSLTFILVLSANIWYQVYC